MATYRRSYVFRLASDPIFYAWTGHGPLVTPADVFDAAGATWLGAAHILDIPTLKSLINGIADRIDISVSGVSPEALRLALEDRESVRNASAMFGWVEFDEDWALMGGVHWEWRGYADVLSVASKAGPNSRQRTISISIRSGDTSRSNPQPSFFTDADQRRRSPTDAFFDRVANMSSGVTRRFGPL